MDMNSLLSGLASSQKPGSGKNCGTGGLGGFGGGNSIIWIIILLCLCGGFGQGAETGSVCACKKKHCKEYCKCGFDSGVGGLGGFGGGNGCWWIIILLLLCTCGTGIGGRGGRGCTTNIINVDDCDEE